MRIRCITISVLLVLQACNAEKSDFLFQWSNKKIEGKSLVWADQVTRLYTKFDEEIHDFRHNLVMVRIAPGQFDPQYWSGKNNVLHLTPPSGLAYGRALVDVQTLAEHEELAQLAHNGGGCGNLDPVDLNLNLAEGTDEIIPTLFHERVKLDTVSSVLSKVSQANIKTTIKEISDIGTRMHTTSEGKAVPGKLVTLWNKAGSGLKNFSVTTSPFSTSQQSNVVARITGIKDPQTIIIIGAHMDTTRSDGNYTYAPGADDDASGIATITEVIRVLTESGAEFERTIEFHAYGAEEFGRLGSIALANKYKAAGRKVAGMFQIDMNAYSKSPNEQTIYFTKEFTNEYLNRVNKDLLQTYLGGDYQEKSLTAGTSDHKSWHQAGYPTVFPFEDPENFNLALHTATDTLDNINNTAKSARFGQLALAYISHHGGLVSAKAEYDEALKGHFPELAESKELPIAVIDSEIRGQYYKAIGAPTNLRRIEACRIESPESLTCMSSRSTYTDLGEHRERRVFLNESAITIKDGDRFRIYGYDVNDVLAATRNIRLVTKSE